MSEEADRRLLICHCDEDVHIHPESLLPLLSEAYRLGENAGLEKVIGWCDDRRNSPDWTTLGMIQEYARALKGQG